MKLVMIRGENCIEAKVSVISRIAKTIETTVIMADAMVLKMSRAMSGSDLDGNRIVGIQAFIGGTHSSKCDNKAPATPRAMAKIRGRTKNPPRSLYLICRKNMVISRDVR